MTTSHEYRLMTRPGSCRFLDPVSVLGIFIFGTNNSHRGLGASFHGIVGYTFLVFGDCFSLPPPFILFRSSDYLATALGGDRQEERCLGDCFWPTLVEGGQFCFCEGFAGGLECSALIAVILSYPLGSCGTTTGLSGGLLLHSRGCGRRSTSSPRPSAPWPWPGCSTATSRPGSMPASGSARRSSRPTTPRSRHWRNSKAYCSAR